MLLSTYRKDSEMISLLGSPTIKIHALTERDDLWQDLKTRGYLPTEAPLHSGQKIGSKMFDFDRPSKLHAYSMERGIPPAH